MKFAYIAALAVLLAASAPRAAARTAQEYAVKASFIAKFVSFTRWVEAEGNRPDSATPLVVSILGPDPFGGVLRDAFRNASPRGSKVRIRVVDHVEDLAGSRVVFLPGESGDRVTDAVKWAAANGALTVGDGDGFGSRGVIINFFLRDDKVRFEINPKAAERSGLQISSLLLKVSRIVEEK